MERLNKEAEVANAVGLAAIKILGGIIAIICVWHLLS